MEAFPQKADIHQVDWTIAAKLQNADGSISLGFAGPINGISNDALIVAGGANFPDKMPWEGGKKYYSKEVQVLQKKGKEFVWNRKVKASLPEPIAYCGSTSTEAGIVYAGGENEQGLSAKAYLLKWNAGSNQLEQQALPDLPVALTNIALTHIGKVVYAAGGDEAKNSSCRFFSIDLNSKEPQWKTLPDMPIALANAVAIAQKGREGMNVYIIGGRSKTTTGISDLHPTTLVYNPFDGTWKRAANISDGKNISNLSAASGVAAGEHSILITGGDNGKVFHQIETYLAQIAQAGTAEEKARLTEEKNKLVINHQGFYRDVLLYDTQKDSWKKIAELPFLVPVTTTAVKWGKDIFLSNGEIKPGIRTPNVMQGKIKH